MTPAPALLLAAVIAAGSAQAEPFDCLFTAFCPSGEACGETEFPAVVIAADHEGQLFLSTHTDERLLTRLSDAGARPAVYAGAGRGDRAVFLTVRADGTAQLTDHRFTGGSRSVTYFGTCEALQ